MKTPRILSPVASLDGAMRVISAGAQEIYCAVKIPGAVHLLNRQEMCCVPTYRALEGIAAYSHSQGVATLVTLELPFMADFMDAQMKEHILSCTHAGIDAFIVGDIGLILLINSMGLGTPVYASTLLVAMNYEAVDLLKGLGVQRVILERHMSIDEIGEVVRRNQDLEIEVFVHGQGCSNINVNCYMEFPHSTASARQKVMAGMKGVVPPCRWSLDLYPCGDDGRRMARASVLDAFAFCSLCRLPELVHTGVAGLKIVGRCLPVAYQAETTHMYRQLVDLIGREQSAEFGRAQRRRFFRVVRSFQEKPFQPLLQNPDGSRSVPGTIRDILCVEGRCYYAPFSGEPPEFAGALQKTAVEE